MTRRRVAGNWIEREGDMMLKIQAVAWCDVLRQRLRNEVEEAESGMNVSYMTGSLFGDPGGCDSRAMLADRKGWAETLAMLHELEEGLGTLDDEWWNGPKTEKKPTVGDTGTLGFMFASMRDGDASVRRQQEASLDQWEREQRNEHWSRRNEAEAQRANPKRRFRISHWQDEDRTYLPSEQQLDTRIDGPSERREAA